MKDGSPAYFGDGCSKLAKSSQGRNKNFPNTFLTGSQYAGPTEV